MIEDYLVILEDSLHQKLQILEKIEALGLYQKEILEKDELAVEEFDKAVDEKDLLVKKLSELDEGFDSLYEKIRGQLMHGKEKYRDHIAKLQELIAKLTDKSVAIQAQEARNKSMVEKHFRSMRQAVGERRRTSKAAYGYYQNMNKPPMAASQFLDQKK